MPHRFALLLLAGLPSAMACLPVSGDRILARDVSAAVPAFTALPENTVLGYAPVPGATRTFDLPELESIARTHRIALGTVQPVCFQISQLERLPEPETIAAMRRVLPSKAVLELVELPKFSVPAGEIFFPLEGIEPPQPSDPAIQNWKGYVRYAGNRRLPVWARVRVVVERPVVVATRNVRPGETLGEEALAIEVRRGPLKPEQTASALREAVGRTVHRSVKAGDPIPLSALDQATVIHRGDPVKVEVVYGSAHLLLSAIAETNARDGEPVQLRNPATGRVFRARAAGAGNAVVSVGNQASEKSERSGRSE